MKKNIEVIIEKLKEMHGGPRVELKFSNPIELTVAVVLSAQCTDVRVNQVTEQLFNKYTSWQDYLDVPQEELEDDIRSTGFFRNKAKAIKSIASEVLSRFDGSIPDDITTFATIKGIGRKSSNMIVGLVHTKPAIIVDTHMSRVSARLGLTANTEPEKIEIDLRSIVPEKSQTDFSFLMVLHGRYICKARKPDCRICLLKPECEFWAG